MVGGGFVMLGQELTGLSGLVFAPVWVADLGKHWVKFFFDRHSEWFWGRAGLNNQLLHSQVVS